MKLPAGTDGGTFASPQDEEFIRKLAAFRGAVELRAPAGTGFILVDNGRLRAALFRTGTDSFRGRSALSFMTTDAGDTGTVQKFRLRTYSDAEFTSALEICRDSRLLIASDAPASPPAPGATGAAGDVRDRPAGPREFLDPGKLKRILSQPGVIAVSAFFEGFPVQSIGDADFEHVAASAEDFMRAGVKIAQEMQAGPLEQMILETSENKYIIVPCGDLFLCVFTTADTQLGLIRVVLKIILSEVNQ